jgi:hypothetical protein
VTQNLGIQVQQIKGRTAFTFDANDGSLMTPGAIIVSINYENGGTKPEVQIRGCIKVILIL